MPTVDAKPPSNRSGTPAGLEQGAPNGAPDVALPAVTLVIEWENAIDLLDAWTQRAMRGLARELGEVGPRLPERPRVIYLYDRTKVPDGTIESAIEKGVPELRDVADLEIVPTEGLTYYKLKNEGVARTRTPIAVMVDSDVDPQPGWLEALLAPFDDPEVMAVGGFNQLAPEDLVSRAMALTWIFDIKGESARTELRKALHVSNCAVRTEFFKAHPFPDLEAFKKQCNFWMRAIQKEGFGYVRTGAAVGIHAPHPGIGFIAWRGWMAGRDADFVTYHTHTHNRLGRLVYAFGHFGKKLGRSWYRILFRGHAVGLPVWQRPVALIVPLGYFGVVLTAQIGSSLTRSFKLLPPFRPLTPNLA